MLADLSRAKGTTSRHARVDYRALDTMTMSLEVDHLEPFRGAGEIRALLRSVDWSKTPLGSVASWPKSPARAHVGGGVLGALVGARDACTEAMPGASKSIGDASRTGAPHCSRPSKTTNVARCAASSRSCSR